MHGDRLPHKKPLGSSGGGQCASGADNEIWSYGEENEKIFIKYIKIREYLTDYIDSLMLETSINGAPLMRPMFYEFENDLECYEVENQYMFGKDILVAPILEYKSRSRKLYLPKNETFIHAFSGKEYVGGKYYEIETPIEEIPIFYRKNSKLKLLNQII